MPRQVQELGDVGRRHRSSGLQGTWVVKVSAASGQSRINSLAGSLPRFKVIRQIVWVPEYLLYNGSEYKTTYQ
jgi:hypothetical protein